MLSRRTTTRRSSPSNAQLPTSKATVHEQLKLGVGIWKLAVDLLLSERDRHAALCAVQRAGERGAICRKLAGKRPWLRVGQLEIHSALLHRELPEGFVDGRSDLAAEGLQIGADQLPLNCSIGVPGEFQEDVVVHGGDARPSGPSPREGI